MKDTTKLNHKEYKINQIIKVFGIISLVTIVCKCIKKKIHKITKTKEQMR